MRRRDTTKLRSRVLANLERPMAVSYGVIAAILLFGAAGYMLDRALDTSPWLLIAGILLGLALGFYGLASLIRRP